MISQEGKKRIIIAFVFIILGLLIGYSMGSYYTIKAVVEITGGFLDMELVEEALYQYRHAIKSCYPMNLT